MHEFRTKRTLFTLQSSSQEQRNNVPMRIPTRTPPDLKNYSPNLVRPISSARMNDSAISGSGDEFDERQYTEQRTVRESARAQQRKRVGVE